MINKILVVYKKNGFLGTLKKILLKIKSIFFNIPYYCYRIKYIFEPEYKNPDDSDLTLIEKIFQKENILLYDYFIDTELFQQFKKQIGFPCDYHGGHESGVYEEKILEHYIAYDLLNLKSYSKNEIYIDVAAASSPWAKLLRDQLKINSYAIDLELSSDYNHLSYYVKCDATKTFFEPDSINGLSLQCAFEMFQKNDDINFIVEIARILKPGGKTIIVPLYMHTEYCCYISPEYYKKGYSESELKEYICRRHSNIFPSRKYDVIKLKTRIIDQIIKSGLNYKIYVLKNKKTIHREIYCHFILEVSKPK